MNCRIVFRFKLSALRSLRIIVILIEPLTTVGKMVGKLVENAVELQYVKNNSFFRRCMVFFTEFRVGRYGSNKISIKMQ